MTPDTASNLLLLVTLERRRRSGQHAPIWGDDALTDFESCSDRDLERLERHYRREARPTPKYPPPALRRPPRPRARARAPRRSRSAARVQRIEASDGDSPPPPPHRPALAPSTWRAA